MKLMQGARVEDDLSDSEEAAGVTEDIPSNEETSGGEREEGSSGPEEEDQQSAYLSLGARPKTGQNKK